PPRPGDATPAVTPRPQPVHLGEATRRERAAAVAQLQTQVDRAVARRKPVLTHAGIDTVEPLPRPELGDARRPGRLFHRVSLQARPDTSEGPTRYARMKGRARVG